MTKADKKDLLRNISNKISELYKYKTASFIFEYDSEDIYDDTDLLDYIENKYIYLYEQAIKNDWYPEKDMYNEKIYILDTIKEIIIQYQTHIIENEEQSKLMHFNLNSKGF